MIRTIPLRESLKVEFKSDRRRLSDADLVAAVVCLANTDGGDIYLGVEKDGTITGLHPEHQSVTGLAALIANRTIPSLGVRVTVIEEEGTKVARIEVSRSWRLVATSDGLLQRRRLMADGSPECVPMYPHEFASRQSDLGLLDYSSLPVTGASEADLDPVERARLRQFIDRFHGDSSLLPLSDEELDGALRLATTEGGRRVPTVAGLLLIGKDRAIRDHLPTHEVAFQILEGMAVRANEFYRGPLLQVFERIELQTEPLFQGGEIDVGFFRVPLPHLDRQTFREALANAVIHRDYAMLGAVHVRREDDWLTISNPGGFVEGISRDNLLVVEPRPRNPLVADIVKRVGLAERTGRGVDRIYQGTLRYGRPEPDYSGSDRRGVVVRLNLGDADVPFVRFLQGEERRLGAPMPLDSLIVLARLRRERRIDGPEAAAAIQKGEPTARTVLEQLVEAGLVDPHGARQGRTYTLSARVYREFGQGADYVRQAGFDQIQQEQMVVTYVKRHGRITRKDVVDLCRIGPDQAKRLLGKLVRRGDLKMIGERRAVFYERA